ncbi:hypothetical protein LLH00_14920 [bacterium]|nr:hypothetical protein [bacterium]
MRANKRLVLFCTSIGLSLVAGAACGARGYVETFSQHDCELVWLAGK